jgi:hypothetical protein
MGQRWGAVSTELVSGHVRALIVRLCASVWFLVLSATSFRDVNGLLEDIAAGRAGPGAWPALLSEGCIVLFYTIICCIMLIRPEPISRAEGLGPALLTMAGTYAAWLIPLLPRGPEPLALYATSAAIVLISEALTPSSGIRSTWSRRSQFPAYCCNTPGSRHCRSWYCM